MITIIVDTNDEYIELMKYATKYVCKQMPFYVCGNYPSNSCDVCYKDNHVKCGIRVIDPIDNNKPNKL